MHITYEVRKFITNIEMNNKNRTQSPIDGIEQRIKDLNVEQEVIIKVCTQLTQFLRVSTLYRLPINGAKNREEVERLKRIQSKFSRSREHIVNLPVEADFSSVMVDLKNIL
ncbi:unnamed protein product [Rotaria sp. Silwood1]|nr:unnamed protein product [Rotaria sp. Silwood1]CAF4823387.1 unnamed protein product [Rotaria sp. Silwood1]CAF4922586.1 unnamed protein product [Rotaria sp. Silwood1]